MTMDIVEGAQQGSRGKHRDGWRGSSESAGPGEEECSGERSEAQLSAGNLSGAREFVPLYM